MRYLIFLTLYAEDFTKIYSHFVEIDHSNYDQSLLLNG